MGAIAFAWEFLTQTILLPPEKLWITIFRDDDEAFEFNVTRCRFAEMYRRLGLADLGPILSCGRDAAMVEGSALLSTMFAGMRASGQWIEARGSNFLDSGAPFYDVYATSDGGAPRKRPPARRPKRKPIAASILSGVGSTVGWTAASMVSSTFPRRAGSGTASITRSLPARWV